jgi:hypothetical protein
VSKTEDHRQCRATERGGATVPAVSSERAATWSTTINRSAADDLHQRSDVTRQHYSIEGQDEPHELRRLVILVAIAALLVLAGRAVRGGLTPANVPPVNLVCLPGWIFG